MGEGFLDHVRAALLRHVQQKPGDASGHVEQNETSDLVVSATQPPRKFEQERPGDRRRGLHTLPEILAPQDDEGRILHRDDVRRAWLLVDERQLAKVLADAKDAEDDLASVFTDEHDLHASAAYDEQRVARIVLEENDAAARIGALPRQLGENLQLVRA